MQVKRVLVTGATGHIGRQVVDQLRGTGCQIRALTRNPESAALPADVEVVRGDLAVADTLDAALTSVDAVFLVWLAPFAAAAGALERVAAHAERVVLLTSPHNVAHPFFQQPNAMRAVHAGLERLIEASGLQWTFLRPHVFALNCLHWWGPQIRNGEVVKWFHGDAETAPIHERDIAAVAARALRDEGHASKEYVITGPESLTQRELLRIIGEAIGRPLRFEELAPDAARQDVLATWPGAIADMLLSAYAAAVARPSHVTTTVAEVTGTPARLFRDWAVDHATEFAGK
jgi:uncharacterized protein YbjT (DUF2867 family)